MSPAFGSEGARGVGCAARVVAGSMLSARCRAAGLPGLREPTLCTHGHATVARGGAFNILRLVCGSGVSSLRRGR